MGECVKINQQIHKLTMYQRLYITLNNNNNYFSKNEIINNFNNTYKKNY